MTDTTQQAPDVPAVPVSPQAVPRLEALATALIAAGLTVRAELEADEPSIVVINPDATDHRDRITCRGHTVDGAALWFWHFWREPIAPARDIRAAVANIRATLWPKTGARRVEL
jgi:hypothetical protein